MEKRLTAFLRVFECRSISKACKILNISQPALSKAIQRLEDELKVPLFRRTPQGLLPTVYAIALARHARIVDDEVVAARLELEQLERAVHGKVMFGASPIVAAGLLPSARTTAPGLKYIAIERAPDALVTMVRAQEIEFAVCTKPEEVDRSDLAVRELFYDEYIAVVGRTHPMAQGRTVTIRDLRAFPWIVVPQSSVVRTWLNTRFVADTGEAFEPQAESTSIGQMLKLVAMGNFVTFTSRQVIEMQIGDGTLVELNCPRLSMRRAIAVVHRAKVPLSMPGELVICALREAAHKLNLYVPSS